MLRWKLKVTADIINFGEIICNTGINGIFISLPLCSLKCDGVSNSSGSLQCSAECDTSIEPAGQSNLTLKPKKREVDYDTIRYF